MKHFLSGVALLAAMTFAAAQNQVKATIDLNNVKDDKVPVTIYAPALTADKVTFHIPKTVPGTYSEDNYGRYLDDVKAFDKNGKALAVTKDGDNSWNISGAKKLAKVTYLVNDTFDTESGNGEFGKDIFSPAGSNILDNKCFLLNLHCFVGYFDDMLAIPCELTVLHPAALFGGTSIVDTDPSDTKDIFPYKRYFEVTDDPILYAEPNYVTYNIGGMDVLFMVYSPHGTIKAKDISADMQKFMTAQKTFLGDINKNKRYTVLLYLSDMAIADAKGFGALEHNTSTTVVFPEIIPKEQLVAELTDVISHEFFHTVTPLSIHAKQIHYFDYTNPKMSEHLWMYEGVTEYFANLFQVNQGLITEDDFYSRMARKIDGASKYDDKMPMTTMSANVLVEPYKAQYLNVYEKGALIGMCIDIIIREKSDGQRGILDLMKKLSAEYGADKPFDDAELFPKITALTYPEVGDFLTKYVSGTTPIPYADYLAKMGVGKTKIAVPMNPFLKDETTPYIAIKPGTKDITILNGQQLSKFFTSLKLEGGDVIKSINGTDYNLDNVYEMVMGADKWKAGDDVTLKIERDGKPMTVSGKVTLEEKTTEGYKVVDPSKEKLRMAWLKG
jgi:predicted metalloprotease with PDZ domain